MKSRPALEWEQHRILAFIRENADPSGKVVIPVSGGLDSDVVARLCAGTRSASQNFSRRSVQNNHRPLTVAQNLAVAKFLEAVVRGERYGSAPPVRSPVEQLVIQVR